MENMDKVITDQAKKVKTKSNNPWKWKRKKAPITFSKILVEVQGFYVLLLRGD